MKPYATQLKLTTLLSGTLLSLSGCFSQNIIPSVAYDEVSGQFPVFLSDGARITLGQSCLKLDGQGKPYISNCDRNYTSLFDGITGDLENEKINEHSYKRWQSGTDLSLPGFKAKANFSWLGESHISRTLQIKKMEYDPSEEKKGLMKTFYETADAICDRVTKPEYLIVKANMGCSILKDYTNVELGLDDLSEAFNGLKIGHKTTGNESILKGSPSGFYSQGGKLASCEDETVMTVEVSPILASCRQYYDSIELNYLRARHQDSLVANLKLNSKITKLENKVSTKDTEMNNLNAEITEKREQIGALNGSLATQKELNRKVNMELISIDDASSEILHQLQEDFNKSQIDLTNAKLSLLRANNKLVDLIGERTVLEEGISKLEQELTQEKDKATLLHSNSIPKDEYITTISSYDNEIRSLKGNIETIGTQYNAYRNELTNQISQVSARNIKLLQEIQACTPPPLAKVIIKQ